MSRFVPAGTKPEDAPPLVDDEWAAARREVSSRQAPKQAQVTQEESKSLYETLQANKAAKQAEFEESIRLKNQFKSLDEDDVDFLDSVLESERAKEDAVKIETAEQLDTYRKHQAAAQTVDLKVQSSTAAPSKDKDAWVTKKRRKKELDNPISKLRKTSTGTAKEPTAPEAAEASVKSERSEVTKEKRDMPPENEASSTPPPVVSTSTPASNASALGLDAYSSDED